MIRAVISVLEAVFLLLSKNQLFSYSDGFLEKMSNVTFNF